MNMKKDENPKPEKARLIVHVGRLLVSHSVLFSILCCCGGYVALLLLPILAKNTYISENALLPGSANPTLSSQDTQLASKLVKEIIDKKSNRMGLIKLIEKNMEATGAEVYYHKNFPQNHEFHPLSFFSSFRKNSNPRNTSCPEAALSVVGIIRAPQGEGKESIVIITPFNSNNIKLSEAVALGVSLSTFSLLSHATWLAKDIIWVAADASFGEYDSVASWLEDYFNPNDQLGFDTCHVDGTNDFTIFRRAGTMAAALVLKVDEKEERESGDSLTILSEASNGQMPNLDLINTVHFLAVHRQGFSVRIPSPEGFDWSMLLGFVGQTLEFVSGIFGGFRVTGDEYVGDTARLASSVYSQALGVPSGAHGAFREYQIDAVTLELGSRVSLDYEFARGAIFLKGGRLLEGVIRSVNNLLEKFHQSFFLYLLTSPNKFISVGTYMIPLGLLLSPLPISVAALLSKPNETLNPNSLIDKKWSWLRSLKSAFIVYSWAALVSLLPFFIPQGLTSNWKALTWVSLSIFSLFTFKRLFRSTPFPGEWVSLKAVMLSSALIGFSLMSVINFSASLISALLLVPLCLTIQPFRERRDFPTLAFAILFMIISFPPVPLLVSDVFLGGSRERKLEFLWDLMESLWVWNSATYLYLFLFHLPCWVLCVHVLFHP